MSGKTAMLDLSSDVSSAGNHAPTSDHTDFFSHLFPLYSADQMIGRDVLSVAVISESEIVEYGVLAVLAPYENRVRVTRSSRLPGNPSPVDLTLIDASIDTRAGVATVDSAVQDPAAGRVVLLDWQVHPTTAQWAIERGCKGCVHMALGPAEFVNVLERIGDGETVVSPSVCKDSELPGDTGESEPWMGHSEGLTRREGEMISLISQGFRNREIAASLFLSINSVKSYVRLAYRKVGVESRSEAVRWGIEHGMLPAESGQFSPKPFPCFSTMRVRDVW